MPGVNIKQVLLIVAAVVVVVAAGLAVLEVSGTTAILSGDDDVKKGTSSAAVTGSGDDVEPHQAKWVVEENRKPGTNKWRLTGPAERGEHRGLRRHHQCHVRGDGEAPRVHRRPVVRG